MALSRSDSTALTIRGLSFEVTACLLLVPAGLALLALGVVASQPDSDTGEQTSTVSTVAVMTLGVRVVLICIPITYLLARNRPMLGALVTAAAVRAVFPTV